MSICLVVPHLGGGCVRGGGEGTRPIFGYGNILNFIAMFGTNNKIHTVLFWNHLLCDKIIAGEQIYVTVIDLVLKTWSIIKFHQANQINHILYPCCMQYPVYNWGQTCTKFNTLFRTNFHAIVYPVWDREDKNHTTSFSSTSLHRPYKGLHPQVPKQLLQKFWKFIPWGV